MAAPPKKPPAPATPSNAKRRRRPSPAALQHANKITHRAADGQFKSPPKLQPPPMPDPQDVDP